MAARVLTQNTVTTLEDRAPLSQPHRTAHLSRVVLRHVNHLGGAIRDQNNGHLGGGDCMWGKNGIMGYVLQDA